MMDAERDINDPSNQGIIIDYDDRPLREKNLYEVLKGFAGDPFYSRGIHISRYAETVTENYAIIDGIQKLFQDLSDEHNINYSDVLRVTTIHGYNIYMVEIGIAIEKSFSNQRAGIRNRERRILGGDNCNINLDECGGKHTSFQIDKTISGAIGSHSRKGCIPKYKLVTICMCYSLAIYPDLRGWHEIFTNNIRKFEEAQRDRMGI